MKNKNILITAVIAVIIGGAFGFFGGIKYQQNKMPRFDRQAFGQMGTGNGQGNNQRRMGNGQVTGEIISVDEKSITVKTNDGNSKIVLISEKTSINQASSAQISDLKVGEKVMVFGTSNTDGSVSGQSIQLNPNMPNIPSGTPTGTSTKTN